MAWIAAYPDVPQQPPKQAWRKNLSSEERRSMADLLAKDKERMAAEPVRT